MESNGTDNNCSVSLKLVAIFNLVRGGAAVLSLLGCLALILALVILKKYKDPAQRLVLYLTIAVVINSVNSIVRGAGFQLIGNTPFCEAVAFFSGYTSGSILLAICCIVTELFIKAILNKATGNRISVVYFTFIFVQPFFIYLIPFLGQNYGQEGPTCWIKSYNNLTNCTLNYDGLLLQNMLWNLPVIFLLIGGGIMYVITLIAYNRRLKKYRQVYTSEKNRMIDQRLFEDIMVFRWYPLVFIIINVVPFLTRLTQVIDTHLPKTLVLILWIITALVDGLQGLFLSLAFTLNSQTRKSLAWPNIKEAFIAKFHRRTEIDQEFDNNIMTPMIEYRSLSKHSTR